MVRSVLLCGGVLFVASFVCGWRLLRVVGGVCCCVLSLRVVVGVRCCCS